MKWSIIELISILAICLIEVDSFLSSFRKQSSIHNIQFSSKYYTEKFISDKILRSRPVESYVIENALSDSSATSTLIILSLSIRHISDIDAESISIKHWDTFLSKLQQSNQVILLNL